MKSTDRPRPTIAFISRGLTTAANADEYARYRV